MQSKLHTVLETAALFSLTVIITTVTMLGALGVDPLAPNNALSTTTAKVAQ